MAKHISANPQYYDYIHCLTLYDNGKCCFGDGAGQRINNVWHGTWQIQQDNVLELVYTKTKRGELGTHIILNIKYQTIDETIIFFDGYAVKFSKKTWILDYSPCPSFIFRSGNLCQAIENTKEILHKFYEAKFYEKFYEKFGLRSRFLRYADARSWLVESLDDTEPIIASIERGLEAFQKKLDKAQYEVDEFIQKNASRLPFSDSAIGPEELYTHFRNNRPLISEFGNIYINLELLCYNDFAETRDEYRKYINDTRASITGLTH